MDPISELTNAIDNTNNDDKTYANGNSHAPKDIEIDMVTLFPVFNRFIAYHNSLHGEANSMLDGIDYNDKSSTTYLMEKFFGMVQSHAENENSSPGFAEIYEPNNPKLNGLKEAHTIYILEIYNDKENMGKCNKFYSKSLFSLLKKVTDQDIDYNKWKIMTFE